MLFLLKGCILSKPLLSWVQMKKKNHHDVVVLLGFETALCRWWNDRSSAQWFYDTTGMREVKFRLWLWSPAVFGFFPPHRRRMRWEVLELFSPVQLLLLLGFSPFYLNSFLWDGWFFSFSFLRWCYVLQFPPSLWNIPCSFSLSSRGCFPDPLYLFWEVRNTCSHQIKQQSWMDRIDSCLPRSSVVSCN